MASSSANRKPSTVEEIFNDFKLRRTALITALTTKVDEFEQICREVSVSGTPFYLYGRSDGQWRVLSPIRVPLDFPQPTIWLNLPVDSEDRVGWLCSMAVHSDSWLLAMIGYYTAGLSRVERMTVMCLTCTVETVYEMVARFYHHGDASPETTDVGLTALADAAAAIDHPTAPTAGATALTAAPSTVGATAPLTTDPDVGLTALADAAAAIDHPTAPTAPTAGATALTAAPLTVGATANVCHSCHRSDPVLPRTTDWIECDKCDSWYHELCTGLSVAQLKIARGADKCDSWYHELSPTVIYNSLNDKEQLMPNLDIY